MKYDTNMTEEQRAELLQKIKDTGGKYIEGVYYDCGGYFECDIRELINQLLWELEAHNRYYPNNKYYVGETMEIGVFVFLSFPKYEKGIWLEDIQIDTETREYRKGIYLNRILEYLDDRLRGEPTETSEVTDAVFAAEKSLYDTMRIKDNEESRYAAEKALYEALKRDYRFCIYEEIGKIEVKTADYVEDGYQHLIEKRK